MAAVESAPLSAEPANPSERKNQNLPPKSYADAVEEEAPSSNETKETNGLKDTNGTNTNGTDESQESAETNGLSNGKHTAPVLRIVDTGLKQEKKEENKTNSGNEGTAEEYTATVCPPIMLEFTSAN